MSIHHHHYDRCRYKELECIALLVPIHHNGLKGFVCRFGPNNFMLEITLALHLRYVDTLVKRLGQLHLLPSESPSCLLTYWHDEPVLCPAPNLS